MYGRANRTWFDGYGENFGRDDQYLMLRGGIYDLFKYKIYSDSLPHDFLFDGRTPFNGAGIGNLTATFPQPDPSTWNSVNIGYKRTDNGGFFEWQGLAPWYFRVDLNQVEFDGTKIGSGANGTSPGNGFTDLIFPTQYKTKNATAEGGYSSGNLTASLSYLYSKFENDFTTFTWNNGFFGNNVDTTYIAPENSYQRIAANLTYRDLPWHSTFAARYTWSEAKSDATLAQTALNSTGANPYGPTLPNVDTFNGNVKNQTFTATFASHPAKAVDTRVYYNYYKRNNDSTDVIYASNSFVSCGGACVSDNFEYTKNNFGFDAYWRFLPNNRLGGGWDYWDIKQNRHDYDKVTDEPPVRRVEEHVAPQPLRAPQVHVLPAPLEFPAGRCGRRRQRPGIPRAFHVPVRPVGPEPQRGEADRRLEPGAAARFLARGHVEGQRLPGHRARANFRQAGRHLSQRVVGRSLEVRITGFGDYERITLRFEPPQRRRRLVR